MTCLDSVNRREVVVWWRGCFGGCGAGPRESKSGEIQKRTKKFLVEVLSGLGILNEMKIPAV